MQTFYEPLSSWLNQTIRAERIHSAFRTVRSALSAMHRIAIVAEMRAYGAEQ